MNSALIKDSQYKATKAARLKAIRSLFGDIKKIQLSPVDYISDYENIQISEAGEHRILLSDFLAIQEERISGIVKSFPIVSKWLNTQHKIVYVATGKIFDDSY